MKATLTFDFKEDGQTDIILDGDVPLSIMLTAVQQTEKIMARAMYEQAESLGFSSKEAALGYVEEKIKFEHEKYFG